MDMKRYDGIIFDFNGTLFFDSDKQEEAWRVISLRTRGREFTKQEMRERMHGCSGKSIFEYLLGRSISHEEEVKLMAEKEEIYRELCLKDREHFHLAPGAESLLDWLCAHGVPHTIATASEIVNVRFFREHFGLDRWFDPAAIVYDDGTHPGKPYPDIYLKAAAKIGLPPERCIVVEDARSGIESARRAGAGCIVAMDSGAVDSETLHSLPCVSTVIQSFDQLDRSWLSLERSANQDGK